MDDRIVRDVFENDFSKDQKDGLYTMIGLLLGMAHEQQDVSMFLMGQAVKDARTKRTAS